MESYILLSGDEIKMDFFKGIFIGAAAILPGISSGVLCMIFGIYEELINSILGFFKNFRKNLRFLFPILLGGIVGIILFSNLIAYCLTYLPCPTKSLFIGLLLGSIIVLIEDTISHKNSSKKSSWICFLVCFLLGIFLIYLENKMHFSTEYIPHNEFSTLYLIFAGLMMSIGIVVPGISSTVILMLLGVYTTYLSAISVANMTVILPMIFGCGIGCLLFMKLIQYFLQSFHLQTMFGIVGFSLGSIFILYPHYSFNLESIIGMILLFLGFLIGKNIRPSKG